jgi:hypothetical protein
MSGGVFDQGGGGADSSFMGEESPELARVNSPAHRAAASFAKMVYSSPAKSSHRWASAFGAVE